MANFEEAVKVVLKHEGKFNDDPHDAGHATNYGISLRFLQLTNKDINADGAIDIKDILALDPFTAKKIYKEEWWNKHNYDLIKSQIIATKIFDLAVNMGASQCHVLVQNALNEVRKSTDSLYVVKVDGIFGPYSIAATNHLIQINKESQLLRQIKLNAGHFYSALALKRPNLKRFLNGWMYRTNA